MKRWIRWAAWLYPAAWRARYGAEFDVLLDDAPLHWSDLADVIRGAAIMQMTTMMSYRKMALAAGLAGAILIGGWSLTIPNLYHATAALELRRPGATPIQLTQTIAESELAVLGLRSLNTILLDLDLYKKERQRLSPEDVTEMMFRRHLRVIPYYVRGLQGRPFHIIFDYPDRTKAKAVVERLIAELQRQADFSVLEDPILPETPISPVRSSFFALGALGGMLLGLLTVAIARRTRYAVVTMNIPKDTKRFVDGLVATGQYRDAGEYLRELIRADQERRR